MANFAYTYLSGTHTSAVTTFNVVTGQGSRFTASALATVWKTNGYSNPAEAYQAGYAEIVLIGTPSANSITVTRAQLSTSAIALNESGATYQLFEGIYTSNLVASVSGNSGKVLTTDGSVTSWTANPTLGILTLTGAIIGAASQSVFNTVSTTVNAFGAATALTLGATTGTTTVRNATTFNNANTYFGSIGANGGINLWDEGLGQYQRIYMSGEAEVNFSGMGIAGAIWNGTFIGTPYGGTGLTSFTQGDLIYSSASNTLAQLAKNTTAGKFLSNAGSSNNPSWIAPPKFLVFPTTIATFALNTTNYFIPFQNSASTVDGQYFFPFREAGTLRNFTVWGIGDTDTTDVTWTVRTASAITGTLTNTSITASLNPVTGTLQMTSDTTNTAAISAGGIMDVKMVVSNNGTQYTGMGWSIEFHPTA